MRGLGGWGVGLQRGKAAAQCGGTTQPGVALQCRAQVEADVDLFADAHRAVQLHGFAAHLHGSIAGTRLGRADGGFDGGGQV